MRRVFLVVAMVGAFVTTFSQKQEVLTEGKIVYEEVIKLNITLEGEAAQFADMLPQEQKSEKVLYFNEAYSLYEKNRAKRSGEDAFKAMESEEMAVHIEVYEPENKIFKDLKRQEQIEMREFMGRHFLITEAFETPVWKFTGKSREILSLHCMEAFYENEEGKRVVAWFTPEIPVSLGPGNISGLPGMVLAVDINKGEHLMTAIRIDREKVAKEQLKKPRKGKRVTEEAYRAMVERKMQEMGTQGATQQVIQIH